MNEIKGNLTDSTVRSTAGTSDIYTRDDQTKKMIFLNRKTRNRILSGSSQSSQNPSLSSKFRARV